jgi:hypothetical protein
MIMEETGGRSGCLVALRTTVIAAVRHGAVPQLGPRVAFPTRARRGRGGVRERRTAPGRIDVGRRRSTFFA